MAHLHVPVTTMLLVNSIRSLHMDIHQIRSASLQLHCLAALIARKRVMPMTKRNNAVFHTLKNINELLFHGATSELRQIFKHSLKLIQSKEQIITRRVPGK